MKQAVGDLWTYRPADVRVITTNGYVTKEGTNGSGGRNVMGRGCAREAAERYPGVDRLLGDYIGRFGNRCFVLDEESGLVSMPVKEHWRGRASLALIERSARQLVEMADKFGWRTIVVPRPGCGAGGLDWDRQVRPVVERVFDERFTVITYG